jgi:CubicO group peptidase (beta-lactamase class C family)
MKGHDRRAGAGARRRWTGRGLLALLAVAVGCERPAESGTTPDTAAEIRRIETDLQPPVPVEGQEGWTLAERMQRWNVEAVSVAVIDNSQVRWAQAWGPGDREDGTPATTETLFQAGSISKPVAAAGALRLVEEGKLDLDMPINTYLASWKLPENDLTQREPVTLRRLMSHTAGTTIHGFPGYAPWDEVPTIPQVLDGASPANTGPVRVDLLPGSEVRYSGGGVTIEQLAMTDVTGEPFPELMRRLVLEPAGMTHSTYENPLPDSRLAEAAAGYRRNGAPVPGKRHTYPEMAAAGLWTTPTDLARFAIAIQESLRGAPGAVLDSATAWSMVTPVKDQTGLGFFMQHLDGAPYFGHNGADEGFQALLVASRDGGYGAVVMANSDNGVALAEEIVRAIAREYGWDDYLADAVTPVTPSEQELQGYTGRFGLGPNQVGILSVRDGQLWLHPTLDETARMIPLGDGLFLYESRGWTVRIRRDEDGRAAAIETVDAPFHAMLRRIPDDRPPSPVELIDAGRMQEALAALEASGADEGDVNELGYALINAGRFDDAVDLLAWNAERHPGHANPWDSLADAYVAAGDTTGAVEAYRKVLEAIRHDEEAAPAALAALEQRARSALRRFGAD